MTNHKHKRFGDDLELNLVAVLLVAIMVGMVAALAGWV